MRQRQVRMNPLEPIIAKRKRLQKGRSQSHRMNRRTNIVAKSRQGQFRGASSPARRFVPLYHKNFLPFLSKPDRCSKAIRSRPNDYAVVFGGVIHPALQNKTAPTLLREERKR